MIVVNHVTRSLQPPQLYSDSKYSILLSSAPQSIQEFILGCFCYLGPIGNAIFLVSSIWFLLEDQSIKSDKVKKLILDTWVVSVVLCAVFTVLGPTITPRSFLLRSLFPVILCNNWYVTCYLILYLIHPALNIIIEAMEQKALFRMVTGLFFAYFIVALISEKVLYYSNLVFFLSSYLIVGYIKRYFEEFVNNVKTNKLLILVTVCICILMHGIMVACSKHVPALHNKMLMWTSNNNPFTFFMAFSLFNIARAKEWQNSFVNRISGLTLLIYIIHENIYVKSVLRPSIWERYYTVFGHSHLVLADIVYSVALFAAACFLAAVFRWVNKRMLYKILSTAIDWGTGAITRIIKIL